MVFNQGSTVVGLQRTLQFICNTSTNKIDFLSRISLLGSQGFEEVMLQRPTNVQMAVLFVKVLNFLNKFPSHVGQLA